MGVSLSLTASHRGTAEGARQLRRTAGCRGFSEGGRWAGGTAVEGGVRPFDQIPSTGRSGWINLARFWKEDVFRTLHLHMERTFNRLGPIYRERLGSSDSVNVLLPQDIGELFRSEGLHPRRMLFEPWAAHREYRGYNCGVFLKNGAEWREDRLLLNREVMTPAAVMRFLPLLDEVARDFVGRLRGRLERGGRGGLTVDLAPELFRFTLESICHVLYGERVGLLSDSPNPEAQRFISAVELMLETTLPLLYLPPRLLQRLGAPLWKEHVAAWDHIFQHADERVQSVYRKLRSDVTAGGGASDRKYPGVLAELLLKGELPLERIRANITELMAGGVDTTAVPLQFCLFELARTPSVQDSVRRQVQRALEQAGGDVAQALRAAPLLRGTVKEILRLYPVGISVQRYPVKDIVLQNYHIPAGTLVQACLYPLGRSSSVFLEPLRFWPERWLDSGSGSGSGSGFRSLAFGFGSRQCVGRRIAETEMQLFLMHILKNFKLEVKSKTDLRTKYTLILQPESPLPITFTLLTPDP
ncbi:cytochrome P450 11B, mitochondrial-like isoform X2 [Acipenser ruthenus]|uniref:cytochrome P450 11B, mitochondrial-like isoform X2 n=1 Tax=Acipenser ruthenus TaxID=7906 RepID=UPI00274159B9|nr:cytochrome P450 11B, mitochondrial-like isoform X2 [Acipenser ruthenus]